MESILDLIWDPSKCQRARRVLLYGVEGVGKTTWGAAWPDSLLVPCEDGQRHISCRALPLQTSFDTCLSLLGQLYSLDPFPFRTIVVDTIDALESMLFASVALSKGKNNIEDIGYGKGFAVAAAEWRKFLNGLEWFTINRNCNIVLLGHATIEKFQDPTGDTYDRYVPRLQKQSSYLIREWCDEVLFANHKVLTREKEEAFNQKRTVGIDGGRCIRCTEKPAHMAKNRLAMPDEIAMSYEAYAKYLPQPANVAGLVVDGSSKTRS